MRNKQKAFTLIELLVALTVVGVLVGIAVPGFKSQVVNNQSVVLGEQMTDAINYARSEALKRGKMVTLCPSNDAGEDCGSVWKNGWLVVVDTAATETTKPPKVATPTTTSILRRWEKSPAAASIVMTDTSRQFIRFTGLGTLARTDGTSAEVTTKISGCTTAKVIKINVTGMLSISTAACN